MVGIFVYVGGEVAIGSHIVSYLGQADVLGLSPKAAGDKVTVDNNSTSIKSNDGRVWRGGSFDFLASFVRSANRSAGMGSQWRRAAPNGSLASSAATRC